MLRALKISCMPVFILVSKSSWRAMTASGVTVEIVFVEATVDTAWGAARTRAWEGSGTGGVVIEEWADDTCDIAVSRREDKSASLVVRSAT